MPADQYGAEPGMEHPCVDFIGAPFLAGDQHLVVCGRICFMGPAPDPGYVADGLGN